MGTNRYNRLPKAILLCFFSLAFFSKIAGISIPFNLHKDSSKVNFHNYHYQENTPKVNFLEFVEILEIEEDSEEDDFNHFKALNTFTSNFLYDWVAYASLLEGDLAKNKTFFATASVNSATYIPLYTLFCTWRSFLV
jgi:hypothetical protein